MLRFSLFAIRIRQLAGKLGRITALFQASAMLAPTDLDDRRNWSVREYFSSFGNRFVVSKILC
jgi:hypothetical protein